MEKPQTIILYSKYSQNSKRILDSLRSVNIDWEKLINLQLICIDNENIRKRILASKDIQIKTVPCILILYSDGVVEKFDGPNSFEWVENIIQKNEQPKMPQVQYQNQHQNPAQNTYQPSQPIKQPTQAPHVQSRAIPKQTKPTKQTNQTKQTKQSKFSNATLIDELVSEEEQEGSEIMENREDESSSDEIVSISKRPPMRIRTDAGNFEEIDTSNFEEQPPPEARDVSRHIKKPSATKEKTDIISKAAALEKARQTEDSGSNRNKNGDFSRGA